jgi:hypothetical protein
MTEWDNLHKMDWPENPLFDMPVVLKQGDRVAVTTSDGETYIERVKAVKENKTTGEVEIEFE